MLFNVLWHIYSLQARLILFVCVCVYVCLCAGLNWLRQAACCSQGQIHEHEEPLIAQRSPLSRHWFIRLHGSDII